MDEETFKRRTRALALAVIGLTESLPRRTTATVIGRQVVRSATSVGANYRASCRARSVAEIIAKLSIVEEEADETMYWLELLVESGLANTAAVQPLLREASEIVAMTVASKKTLKRNAGVRGFSTNQSKIVNRES